MSLTDKLDQNAATTIARMSLARRRPTPMSRALAVFALAALASASALLFAAGCPIIAIWAALALLGWLFLAGAAESESGAEDAGARDVGAEKLY
ncbi:hypothetical protein [Methylosinus sporium]|nr:hypothetical protein [Methylosinus sporium]